MHRGVVNGCAAVAAATALGAAEAAGNGLVVRFVPVLQSMQVTITDLVGASKQNCSYDAVPQASPVIPGLPTGTGWDVSVSCVYDPPNPFDTRLLEQRPGVLSACGA